MISSGGSSAQVVASKVVDIKSGVGVGGSEGQKVARPEIKSRVERSMVAPTREEIDAKIETISARMDTKFESILSEIRLTNLNIANLANSVSEVRVDNKNTRWTIIITVISATIASLGLMVSMQAGLLSALQTNLTIKQTYPQLQSAPAAQAQPPKTQ